MKTDLALPQTDNAVTARPLYPLNFWLVLSMMLLFSAVLKLQTLYFPHTEPDEQVYLTLAERLLNSGSYTLQGSEILKFLSPGIYDRPLFFHPPLFPVCLIPFVYWQVESLAVLLSWFGHFLTIISVAIIGRRMAFASGLGVDRGSIASWLPVIAISLDPLLTFISRKLWIDSLLSGLCAAAIAAFFCARYSRHRSFWLVTGGILFGLAGLCKMTALVLTPIVIYLILTPDVRRQSKIKALCLGCLPILLLTLPWYIAFYRTYGVIIPSWTKPDDWTIQNYSFVRRTLARTPGYYLWKLATVAPVSLFAFGVYGFKKSLWTSRLYLFPLVWFLLFFITISYWGLHGAGFQMRFIAPLIPSIYLMLYAVVNEFRRGSELIQIAVLLSAIYGGMMAAVYLLSAEFDEIHSIFEFIGWIRP